MTGVERAKGTGAKEWQKRKKLLTLCVNQSLSTLLAVMVTTRCLQVPNSYSAAYTPVDSAFRHQGVHPSR